MSSQILKRHESTGSKISILNLKIIEWLPVPMDAKTCLIGFEFNKFS